MKILLFVAAIFGFFMCIRFLDDAIIRFGNSRNVSLLRVKYIAKTINIALFIFFALLLVSISGVEYSQITIFLSSIFAVLGVALFAQWSILSNVTASLIIFFGFPYRVGDEIKVIDKDDDISGVIEEIELFHVLIRRGDQLITYPNTLILQKEVIMQPKNKHAPDTEKPEPALDTPAET